MVFNNKLVIASTRLIINLAEKDSIHEASFAAAWAEFPNIAMPIP